MKRGGFSIPRPARRRRKEIAAETRGAKNFYGVAGTESLILYHKQLWPEKTCKRDYIFVCFKKSTTR